MVNQQEFNNEDEANYVLGMMDMYESDEEIAKMLRLKRIPEEQVQKILSLVRREGYIKRIRQAKRIMLIGYGIVLLFVVGGTLVYFYKPEIIFGYLAETDPIGRRASNAITSPMFYGFVYGILQAIFGTIKFFSYKRKLSRLVV